MTGNSEKKDGIKPSFFSELRDMYPKGISYCVAVDSEQINIYTLNKKMAFQPSFLFAGEVTSRWNQILPSLLATFEKLKSLGFTYYNGSVSVIVPEKEDNV